MFPLRDVHRPSRTPVVTRLLVAVLVGVWAWQVFLAFHGREGPFVAQWAARPRCVVAPASCGIDLVERPAVGLGQWLAPLLSSAFLHAGIVHLAFNAWFLWVFGPAVEDRLGRLKFCSFYLACALAATLAHVATQPLSSTPLVGASGAIAGILGAHLILLPRSWILSYIPPVWVLPVPSLLFLLLWIAGQVASARELLPVHSSGAGGKAAAASGVAWAAHIGGFAWGACCAWGARPWFKRRAKEEGTAR
jgi:membrane associated rhomboid family serine protease